MTTALALALDPVRCRCCGFPTTMPSDDLCPACVAFRDGVRATMFDRPEPCDECDGRGTVVADDNPESIARSCPACAGSGVLV